MERHEILEALTELKLYGMRASFDEIAGKGLNRRDEIFPFLASLIRAEPWICANSTSISLRSQQISRCQPSSAPSSIWPRS